MQVGFAYPARVAFSAASGRRYGNDDKHLTGGADRFLDDDAFPLGINDRDNRRGGHGDKRAERAGALRRVNQGAVAAAEELDADEARDAVGRRGDRGHAAG
jgi:hypothetical protein